MGNKPGGKKTILKVDNEEIILHNSYSMKLTLGEMQIFPHGLDGLKLWDAGIVLARYGILNPAYFKDKDVLELGAGVGIAGIAIQKWTQCKSITMTDYHEGVVSNIGKNMKKNQISEPAPIVFDWCKPEQLTTQFDVIIGSDIVYFGCPVKELYSVFERLLKSGGRGLIIIPDRKNYA
jgi:predicted nicotinamide N-methyase